MVKIVNNEHFVNKSFELLIIFININNIKAEPKFGDARVEKF